MKLTVQPIQLGLEAIEVEVGDDMTVSTLREEVARKMEISGNFSLKLVYDGVELKDGPLARYDIDPSVAVRVVVVRDDAAVPRSDGAAPPAATAAEESGPEGDGSGNDFVSEAEISRAIIVTGIPAHKNTETEKALLDAFSAYGTVERVIVQKDAEDGGKQHAILVLARESGAAAALAFNDHHILGGRVSVFLASALAASEGEDGTPRTAAAQRAAGTAAVASFLAAGYCRGRQGVAWVARTEAARRVSEAVAVGTASAVSALRSFDRTHRVSERVSTTTKDLDERYKISENTAAVASRAAAAAAAADERYRISHHAAAAAKSASDTAAHVSQRAMEHEGVRRGVNLVGSWLSAAASAVDATVARTKEEIARREALEREEEAARENPPAPPATSAAKVEIEKPE